MSKPLVFISYSRADARWKKLLERHLRLMELDEVIAAWHDGMIETGEKWYPKIKDAMSRAAVAVCLISTDFLISDFVRKEEIPHLLKQSEAGGTWLMPVIVMPCSWESTEWLKRLQMFPDPKKPLASLKSRFKQEQALSEITKKIAKKIEDPTFVAPKPAPEWPELSKDRISIERLPRTGTEVFGRGEELKLLDESWQNESQA